LVFQTEAADLPLLTSKDRELFSLELKKHHKKKQDSFATSPDNKDGIQSQFRSTKKNTHHIRALDIPNEIWLKIMEELDLNSFISILDVNTKLRRLGASNQFLTFYKITRQEVPKTLEPPSYLSTLNYMAVLGDKNAAGIIMTIVQTKYLQYRLSIPYFEGAVLTMIAKGWTIKSWKEEAASIDLSLQESLLKTDYPQPDESCMTDNLLTENGLYLAYKLCIDHFYSMYVSNRNHTKFSRKKTPLYQFWTDLRTGIRIQHDILSLNNYDVSLGISKPTKLVETIRKSQPLIRFIRAVKLLKK
jgi:hypothetical protein